MRDISGEWRQGIDLQKQLAESPNVFGQYWWIMQCIMHEGDEMTDLKDP
jgi:hypothetical protein